MRTYERDGLRIELQKADITKLEVDAVVNAANERMLGGGGVDGAIHRAAGPALREACEKVAETRPGVRCPTGEARITPAFELPASHVIHTVGPVYRSAEQAEPLLRNAYRNALALANEQGLRSIAFPAISCGVYGYPLGDAASVALETCRDHAGAIERIVFALFDDAAFEAFAAKADALLS